MAEPVPMQSRKRLRDTEELVELLTDVRILVVDTARVWWRLLPQLFALYLLGWLGSQLSLRAAVWAGDHSAWLALVLFTFSFLAQLTALVLILRLVGRELGVRALIPEEETVADGRDDSISGLLAVTLLPFLGLYAAFGQVTDTANQLVVEQASRYSPLASDQTVLGVLDRAATNHPLRLLAVVVGVYVLRRVLDAVHESTGWRLLGLAVAFVESFFILVVVLGGVRLLQRALAWVRDRQFWAWLDHLRDAVAALLAHLAINLPAVLHALAGFLRQQVWPVVWEAVSQPIIWLAVVALVYGSQVLSLAELWRRGQTYAGRLPRFGAGRRRRQRAARRVGPAPVGFRRVVGEAREAFLGDVDDKYLPTFHSLRLVLRAGLVFLGSFVLVYALLAAVTALAGRAQDVVVGGHLVDFSTVWGPWLGLGHSLVFEPVRLCLLAVAFRRCLELFQRRSGGPVAARGEGAVAAVGRG